MPAPPTTTKQLHVMAVAHRSTFVLVADPWAPDRGDHETIAVLPTVLSESYWLHPGRSQAVVS